MNIDSAYRLAEGVQVRNETFGLLFYDYRGPRLYFVPCGNLICDAFFDGLAPVADLVRRHSRQMPASRERIELQIVQVLEKLENKGLIYEQCLC